MIRKITFLFFIVTSTILHAQVGIGTAVPNNDSVLEIQSDSKAVLISRVALSETVSPSPLSHHVAGMIVYNSSTSGTGDKAVFEGFYYNDGNQWIRLEPLPVAVGDIKQSMLSEDHNGWYKLDGRATASLPVKAALNATSLGFGLTIPDATDRFLKGKSTSEPVMATGGNNAVSLTQDNLPNVTFSGVTNTAGSHTHEYTDRYHGVAEDLNLVTGLLGILGGTVLNILYNDVGSNTVSVATSTSSGNGNHSHIASVSTGGNSTPLDNVAHLVANTFVYLGK